MDRRDVLKVGAAAALAGCAAETSRPAVPPPMTPSEVDGVLAELDATLGRMRAGAPNPEVLLGAATDSLQMQRGHELVVKTFASMHLAATFRELPTDVQARPDVQERMWRAMPEMDDAMLSLTEVMQKLTPAERKALQQRLKDDPELGMRVVEKLDEQAKSVGVNAKRRTQMRAAAAHATWRMTHQSVDSLLDECIDKTRRVVERNGRDAEMQRAVAAKLTELGLFGPPEGAGGAAHLTLASAVGGGAQPAHRASKVLLVGGILLGVGVLVGGGGGLLVATGTFAGVLLITAGALLGLAALIVLIVGAVMAASEPSDPADPEEAK